MEVYVAAPWTDRWKASAFAARCEAHGHTITRKWWEYEAGNEEHEKLREQAIADFDAVAKSEAVVVLQLNKSEGKAAETGYAIAHDLPVVVVTYDDGAGNIFHHHPAVQMVKTENDALAALTRILYSAVAPLR